LQLDGKNRAMLRSFRLVPGHYSDSASLLQPSLAQQRLHPLLPGRYGQVSTFRNTLKSNNEDSYYFFISVLHIEYYKSLLPKLLHAWSIYE
jgi:hypothetical protein